MQRGAAQVLGFRAAPEAQHQVEGGLLLDVVVCKGAPILQLLAGKNEALLVRGDACNAAKNCMQYSVAKILGMAI